MHVYMSVWVCMHVCRERDTHTCAYEQTTEAVECSLSLCTYSFEEESFSESGASHFLTWDRRVLFASSHLRAGGPDMHLCGFCFGAMGVGMETLVLMITEQVCMFYNLPSYGNIQSWDDLPPLTVSFLVISPLTHSTRHKESECTETSRLATHYRDKMPKASQRWCVWAHSWRVQVLTEGKFNGGSMRQLVTWHLQSGSRGRWMLVSTCLLFNPLLWGALWGTYCELCDLKLENITWSNEFWPISLMLIGCFKLPLWH